LPSGGRIGDLETSYENVFKRFYNAIFCLQGFLVERIRTSLHRQLLMRGMIRQLRSFLDEQLPNCACGAAQLSASISEIELQGFSQVLAPRGRRRNGRAEPMLSSFFFGYPI